MCACVCVCVCTHVRNCLRFRVLYTRADVCRRFHIDTEHVVRVTVIVDRTHVTPPQKKRHGGFFFVSLKANHPNTMLHLLPHILLTAASAPCSDIYNLYHGNGDPQKTCCGSATSAIDDSYIVQEQNVDITFACADNAHHTQGIAKLNNIGIEATVSTKYPPTVGPAFSANLLEAVATGELDATLICPGTYFGDPGNPGANGDFFQTMNSTSFAIYGGIPFSLGGRALDTWMMHPATTAMLQAELDAKFTGDEAMTAIYPCGIDAPESGMIFRDDITTMAELATKKIRTVGLTKGMFEAAGVEVVGGNGLNAYYTFLKGDASSGGLDGLEVSYPTFDNFILGNDSPFHGVTDNPDRGCSTVPNLANCSFVDQPFYYYTNTFHMYGETYAMFVRNTTYNKMSSRQKSGLKDWCSAHTYDRYTYHLRQAKDTLAYLCNPPSKLTCREWTPEIINTLRGHWFDWVRAEAIRNPRFATTIKSFYDTIKDPAVRSYMMDTALDGMTQSQLDAVIDAV